MACSNVVGYLHDQHVLLDRLMGDVRSAEPRERSAVFMVFKRFLAIHEALEFEVIHPLTERVSHSEFDEVSHSLLEEQAATRAIERLEEMDPESIEFLLEFAELDRLICDHAHHEERDEFPGLHTLDDAAESAVIAAALGRSLELALDTATDTASTAFRELLAQACNEFQTLKEGVT
jgi:hypothetical protein